MKTVIRGGTVINASGPFAADVLVDGETIAALVEPESSASASWIEGADRIIDANGRYVLPGAIDAHTHMEMPFGGTHSVDTFETGTRAAAYGGTTTIIDFAIQTKGQSLREGLDKWHEKADGHCAIDYGFHMIVSDVTESSLKEMDLVVDEGVSSFKLFMAYPGVFYSTDGQILQAMQQASSNGATIMMHAENGIAIDVLVAQALARGEGDPRFHGATRPALLEGEATHRAIQLARVAGAPLYIVHLSAAEALAEVVSARDRGQNVFAETCPQYLFLSDDDLAREGFEGAKFVCSPPLRPLVAPRGLVARATHRRPERRLDGSLSFLLPRTKRIGSGRLFEDPQRHSRCRTSPGPHLPGRRSRKDLPRALGRDHLDDAGALVRGSFRARVSSRRGADADLVLYDPTATQTFSAASHHMNVDYSAYEGMSITGQVTTVLSRGTVRHRERRVRGPTRIRSLFCSAV